VIDLDSVLTRVYSDLNESRLATTEDITCDPEYRQPFLSLVRTQLAEEISEALVLRRLTYLRKRSKLPRIKRRKH
jgi:hypothetical protein